MPVKRTSGKAKTKDVFGQLRKPPKMFRAALYARVSTLDQQTLPMQMRPMRDYAANRGWTVVMQAKEVGSGAAQREQRQQLIDAERRREIDVVLVWRLDRWGRSLLNWVTTLQGLTESTGRAMAGTLSVFSACEHDILRERVRAGLDHAWQSDTRLGRPAAAAVKAAEVRKLFRQGISKSENLAATAHRQNLRPPHISSEKSLTDQLYARSPKTHISTCARQEPGSSLPVWAHSSNQTSCHLFAQSGGL
jgi:DNA invertase Pin-like site-specific DNA recombinase